MTFTSKFKVVGIVVVLLPIIAGVIYKVCDMPKNIYTKTLFIDLFIVGLGIYAFSKDRIEDERLVALRLKSLAGALISAIVYCLITSIFRLLDGDAPMTGQELTISALGFYISFFYISKRLDNEGTDKG